METELKFHPLAEILPLIEGEELNELVESVKANGLREPIVLYEGLILDGRNRYRACLAAGVEPRTVEFSGADATAFVRDENIHRRHLTVGQKAMAVAQYANIPHGRGNILEGKDGVMSNAKAGAMVGLPKSAVSHARTVLKHGTSSEIGQVRNGTMPLRTALDKVRARVNSASGFTTPALAPLKDETERMKTKTLRDVMAAVFTAKRHTPKQASAALQNKAFARFADDGLADKVETFGLWVIEIATELRRRK
jgi:hypothetical protein